MRCCASLRGQPLRLTLHRAAVRALSVAGEGRASTRVSGPAGNSSGSAPGSSGAGTGGSASPAAASLAELPHNFRKGARAVFEMPTIRDTIELTDEEQALFKELLDATKQVGRASDEAGCRAPEQGCAAPCRQLHLPAELEEDCAGMRACC